MTIPLYQVDAFTAEPFAGNPAAVCILEGPAEEGWMQNVGAEMNLSETAFLYPEEDGFNLRWFTPTVEVELCGHATLASAHVLWTEGYLPEAEEARFHTQSGLLKAARRGEWLELDFPALEVEAAEAPPELHAALGAEAAFAAKTRFDYFLEFPTEEEVRALAPDFGLLRALQVRGIIATAPAASDEFHVVSRFFAPGAGIDEDPVTGSAHCALGPYWGEKLGQEELVCFQASRRGGIVRVRLAGDRVRLGGQAVTVFQATLRA
jgi:predicted PhzF superfamily epimerase YddE/YHI9